MTTTPPNPTPPAGDPFDPARAASTPFELRYQLTQNFRPYTREEVSRLPRGRRGVYVIWTPSEYDGSPAPLYAGKSETCVRRRLLEHLSDREPNIELRWELNLMPSYIQFTIALTRSPKETDALETYIIRHLQPQTNRAKTGGEKREE